MIRYQNQISNILDIEDYNLIINSLNDKEYTDFIIKTALKIILELGLRRGELDGLEWKDIDFKNHCLNIKNNLIYSNGHVYLGSTKTDGSERTIYASDEILELFKNMRKIQFKNNEEYGDNRIKNIFNNEERDFVMTWQNGHYVHPNYYTSKLKKVLDKIDLGKHIRFHDLRYTNATLLLQQDVDMKTIQERLGHENITTTMNIYSNVTMEMQKKATAKITNLISGGNTVEEKNKNTQ